MATDKSDGDDGEVSFSDLTWEQFRMAQCAAYFVVKALQANAPFTAEDIERIKDHVHPQGVAFWNGYKEALYVLAQTSGALYCRFLEEHMEAVRKIPKTPA